MKNLKKIVLTFGISALALVPYLNTNNLAKRESLVLKAQDQAKGRTLQPSEILECTRLRGRYFEKSDGVVIDQSGSGIEFNVKNCDRVEVAFATSNARIAWTVDGGEEHLEQLNENGSIRVAENLRKDVQHTIKIYKANEAAGGLCEIKYLYLNDYDAEIWPTPEKKYQFEFVGASLTCGNQIDHAKGIDAFGAYPRVVSDYFDADYRCICTSGRGLFQGYNSELNWAASQQNELKDLYWEVSHFRDPSKKYDPKEYEPDVIVFSLGDNDLGENILAVFNNSMTTFVAELDNYYQRVRQAYPDTELIFMYGTYVNRKYSDQYEAKIKEWQQKGDDSVEFLMLNKMGSGADGHPDYAQHKQMAGAIARVIEEKTYCEAVKTIDETALRWEAESCEMAPASSSYIHANQIDFSDWAYLGNMQNATNVSIDQVKEDGSTIRVAKKTINLAKSGYYDFSLGYSTPSSVQIYTKIDNAPWKTLDLPTTGGWATVWDSTKEKVYLEAGNHTIYFTCPNNASYYCNFDYFELLETTEKNQFDVSYPLNENIRISGGDKVDEGDDLKFTCRFKNGYSGKLYVGDEELSKNSNGEYVVKNVKQNTIILLDAYKGNGEEAPKGDPLIPILLGTTIPGGVGLVGLGAFIGYKLAKKKK